VPGLLIQNRQNYAQDLQIAVRGFGSRATFGIRGVRLYIDGIPATMPDGQGQSSNIDIASIDRVEILRGPFSALYGNSSGGVIQVFTEDGGGAPTLTPGLVFGNDGLRRYGVKAAGGGTVEYVLSGSRFTTDGYRDHSAASRNLVNGKLGIPFGGGTKLTLVFNGVDLKAQDPLGLTRDQFRADPRSAVVAARQFDTRKTVRQSQGGLVYEWRIDGVNELRLMAYYGQRETLQFQSIPPAVQANPRHAGGVISLTRDYGGIDARWTARLRLAGGPLSVTGGLARDDLREERQGYENFVGAGGARRLGVQGALRRDESNRVWNIDPYAQVSWQFAQRWRVDAGARRSAVRFSSRDRYIAGINGDDSGAARYRKILPVAALRYQAKPGLGLYATAGRGFETPTLNEISYRSDGLPGLNFSLAPALSTNIEAGAKAQLGQGLPLFRTRTADEIVSAGSVDGRATFRNAGHTRRHGLELGWNGEPAPGWQTAAAYTWLDAIYRGDGPGIAAGNRIPGIARQMAFAALTWNPPQGWRAGVEARYLGRMHVNDSNTEAAPGYFIAAAHAGYLLRRDRSTLQTYLRIDNLFGRRYAGSTIINESNGRYYEPAPGRNWSAGVSAALRF
jgi:iron complex outermembrane receptor protein